MKTSLQLADFIKPDALDEARLRPMATPQEREKSTFDAYYEFLHNASVFSFSLSGQQTQVVTRQQAANVLNQYSTLFDEYAAEFAKFIEINPEQEIKYSAFIDLLRHNEQMFNLAIKNQTVFVPKYSNNTAINTSIAQHWASGNATANVAAIPQPEAKPLGAVPTSRRTDGTPGVSWMKDTIIPLDDRK